MEVTVRRTINGIFWILVYLALVMAPLFVMLIGPERPGRGFWREFSVALGFAGLGMMGLQFLLTTRFQTITAPYGIDVVYHFHRQITFVALVLILAHPVILLVETPGMLRMLNPFAGLNLVNIGLLSVLALVLLVALSVWRRGFRLRYEPWRLTHGLLATAAVVLAMVHVTMVGYYINTPDKRTLWIIMAALWIGSLVYIRIIKPLYLLTRPYKVAEVIPERGEASTLVIRPDGHRGMTFKPGQFVWLTVGSLPLFLSEHPFSISSSAMKNGAVELTIKKLGDWSSRVSEIQPGTRAYLDGPYGAFSLDMEVADGYVFLAGGVGITPIVGMLRTMADRQDRRPVQLYYGSKDFESATFREELDELKHKLNLDVVYVLEEPHEGWEVERGYITPELLARHLPEDRLTRHYFICGPVPMLNAVTRALNLLGVPQEQVHSEPFNMV